MKTIGYAAKCYAIDHSFIGGEHAPFEAFKEGSNFTQEFIPLEEEKPPYGEDILVQTRADSIYFGKMHGGMNGKPDYLQPDLAGSEWQLKIQQIKSWRPIFYK